MDFISAEEDSARRILRKHLVDVESPDLGHLSGRELLNWVTEGVKAGLEDVARTKPVTRIDEESTAEALGTNKGSAPLTESDLDRLNRNRLEVFKVLQDGKRHRVEEFRAVGGSQGDRRARELRPLGFVLKEIQAEGVSWHWYWLLRRSDRNYDPHDVSRLGRATQFDIDEQEAKLERARQQRARRQKARRQKARRQKGT